MRASDAQRAGVMAWVEKWRPRLLLNNHRIEYFWHSRPRKEEDGEETHAATYCGFAGLDVEMHVYPALWKCSAELQEKIILHELVHTVAPSTTEEENVRITEMFWLAYAEVSR